MILKELIQNANIEKVINKITELFPNEKDSLLAYEWLIGKLKSTEPSTRLDDIVIVIYPSIDIFAKDENTKRSEVCGYSTTKKETYDIKLCTHAEWLGMQVSKNSLTHYGHDVFLAYVLWDISFYGFKDTKAKEFIDELEESIDKIEISEDALEQLTESQVSEFNCGKAKIEEIIKKNKKSFCDMLGIKNPEEVSYFTGDNFFMI